MAVEVEKEQDTLRNDFWFLFGFSSEMAPVINKTYYQMKKNLNKKAARMVINLNICRIYVVNRIQGKGTIFTHNSLWNETEKGDDYLIVLIDLGHFLVGLCVMDAMNETVGLRYGQHTKRSSNRRPISHIGFNTVSISRDHLSPTYW